MVMQIWKRDIHEVALLLRFEPGIGHHALVEMGGVGPEVLANTKITHGVGDDVALHDHNSIFGHITEMRLAVVPDKRQREPHALV